MTSHFSSIEAISVMLQHPQDAWWPGVLLLKFPCQYVTVELPGVLQLYPNNMLSGVSHSGVPSASCKIKFSRKSTFKNRMFQGDSRHH